MMIVIDGGSSVVAVAIILSMLWHCGCIAVCWV